MEGRLTGMEGRMVACETQIQVIGERLSGHIDASVAHRESVAGQLSALSAVAQGTQSLLREQVEEARAEREAARRMAEAEATHRREMQTAAAKAADAQAADRWATVRTLATHPAVVSLLTAITAAVGAWSWATWGGPPPAQVGQAAAVGVMSAGVAGTQD